jgi:hypothetical protein
MLEADIEAHLVRRAILAGGEVRKVEWVNRRGAPDRLLMLPGGRTIWVELKHPGRAATFPNNGHERQQAREHIRMREMGQRVEVVDSIAGADALLA